MITQYDVIVSGFGPAGAVAANLLGQRGIRTLVVDRAREVYEMPRAIALDHEIMRVFQSLGIVEQIAPHVAVFPASEYYGTQGQLIKRIDAVPAPYPLGYVPTMVFTQPPVEQALRERAAQHDCIEIELGTELTGLEIGTGSPVEHDDALPAGSHVQATLRDETGATRTVTARYLIACDGASSLVRTSLGIALDDLVFDEPWIVVDLRVNERGLAKLPKVAIQYCEPERPCTYIVGPGGHRRWEIMLSPGEDPLLMQQPEQIWALLSRWLTPDDATLWRASSYRFHALVAAEWRRGPVFIAGDAAHQQPPFIGQGMCQGIRDVVNLVWKLDSVLRGEAGDSLLDTYQAERQEHVRCLTTRIKEIGRVICERDPEAARARDIRLLEQAGGVVKTVTRQEIVPPLQAGLLGQDGAAVNGTLFPQPRVTDESGATRLLDLAVGGGWRVAVSDASLLDDDVLNEAAGLGATVIVLEDDAAFAPALAVAYDVALAIGSAVTPARVVECDGVLAAWFGRHACSAAIIRPDHYVWGVASSAPDLQSQLQSLRRALA